MPKTISQSPLGEVRGQFPILAKEVNGRPLIYLDNAATSQKPQAVIDRVARFYTEENANIHRGVHALSQAATEQYERARARLAAFLGASYAREIVYTRGATEGINLVANGLWGSRLTEGSTVLVSEMEHHANIVPWQLLRDRFGLRLETFPVTPEGEIDLEVYARRLEETTPALVSFVHVSNALGTINPAAEMTRLARERGALVLVDACQSVPHFRVDVTELDCDFLVFGGHKVFGPTGTGVLYGKLERLAALAPYQGGGDMIESVSFEKTRFKEPPERFEAGTPNIAGILGLGEAVSFLEKQDRSLLEAHEDALCGAAVEGLQSVPGVRLVGTARERVAVVSFVMEAAHPHDIASLLDADGIAIRSGHHCTQPLMTKMGLSGTARASFAFYNTLEEVEALVRAVDKVRRFFS